MAGNSSGVSERQRDYMRDYMRRRRAMQAEQAEQAGEEKRQRKPRATKPRDKVRSYRIQFNVTPDVGEWLEAHTDEDSLGVNECARRLFMAYVRSLRSAESDADAGGAE